MRLGMSSLITILAAPLFEWERDDDFSETVKSRNKAAKRHLAAGRTAKAIPLYERTLAECERVLGADHPGTIRSRNNLAMSYQAARRTAEATRLLMRTLADCERVLGAGHPDTRAVRENLAAAGGGIKAR
jgi:Tetratricopeptide repeat